MSAFGFGTMAEDINISPLSDLTDIIDHESIRSEPETEEIGLLDNGDNGDNDTLPVDNGDNGDNGDNDTLPVDNGDNGDN
ncbi:calcium-binding protein, partial [Arthrospira sp. PCC 8006]